MKVIGGLEIFLGEGEVGVFGGVEEDKVAGGVDFVDVFPEEFGVLACAVDHDFFFGEFPAGFFFKLGGGAGVGEHAVSPEVFPDKKEGADGDEGEAEGGVSLV